MLKLKTCVMAVAEIGGTWPKTCNAVHFMFSSRYKGIYAELREHKWYWSGLQWVRFAAMSLCEDILQRAGGWRVSSSCCRKTVLGLETFNAGTSPLIVIKLLVVFIKLFSPATPDPQPAETIA